MNELGAGGFVWKKRRGETQPLDAAAAERKQAELTEIKERRERQEALRKTRLLAREEAHVQESEQHALEIDYQTRAFEYETLRKKAAARMEEPSFFSAIFNLSIHKLPPPALAHALWRPAAPWVHQLQQVTVGDLKNGMERTTEFLDNIVTLVDLCRRSATPLYHDEHAPSVAIDDGSTGNVFKPASLASLEAELEFWAHVKSAIVGELWDRCDKELTLAANTKVELRNLLAKATVSDIWDLGRMTALQLHYAADDEHVDVDFWEAMESRMPWMTSVTWLEAQRLEMQSVRELEVVTAKAEEDVKIGKTAEELENLAKNTLDEYLHEGLAPKFLVEVEDPNEIFDRLIVRERAQEAADSANIIEGGDFEKWLGGRPRVSSFAAASVGATVKPRYFNRIKVAHEWHKYNQVHYDLDNPPPKSVQGYKFMLCYPNLGAKQKPAWKLVKDETAKDSSTVIIRFSASGYEDVGFRIIKREWDLTPRNGYKNIYENGIMILSFMLKRNRYRK